MSRILVDIKRAKTLTGVSRRTIYNWMDHGKVEFVRTAGGRRRIYADTLFRSQYGQRITDDGVPADATTAAIDALRPNASRLV